MPDRCGGRPRAPKVPTRTAAAQGDLHHIDGACAVRLPDGECFVNGIEVRTSPVNVPPRERRAGSDRPQSYARPGGTGDDRVDLASSPGSAVARSCRRHSRGDRAATGRPRPARAYLGPPPQIAGVVETVERAMTQATEHLEAERRTRCSPKMDPASSQDLYERDLAQLLAGQVGRRVRSRGSR